MFISVCAFSLMDVIVKWSDAYPVGQVLFFRGFCGLIPILFIIPKNRFLDFYKTNRPFLHFKRCFAGLIALISIFIALRNLPLATVVSISFAAFKEMSCRLNSFNFYICCTKESSFGNSCKHYFCSANIYHNFFNIFIK